MFAMGPAFYNGATGGYATLLLTGAFSVASVGTAYSSSIAISGGLEPYSLTGGTGVSSGSLDSGFSLSITGTTGARFLTLTCASPATADTMAFTASVDSTDSQTATSAQSVVVAAGSDPYWSSVIASVPCRGVSSVAAATDTKGLLTWTTSAAFNPGVNILDATGGSFTLLDFGTGDCTYEWSNSWDGGFPDYQTAMSHGYVGAGGVLVQTSGASTGSYSVYMSGSVVLTESSSPASGTTVHQYRLVIATMTVGGTTQRYATLYRDGAQTGQSTATLPSINRSGTAIYFSHDPGHPTANHRGKLYDMRITAAARCTAPYTPEPAPYPTS